MESIPHSCGAEGQGSVPSLGAGVPEGADPEPQGLFPGVASSPHPMLPKPSHLPCVAMPSSSATAQGTEDPALRLLASGLPGDCRPL